MIIKKLSLLFFIILFMSCSKDEKLEGRDLWLSLDIKNYSMTQQISCYCYPEDFIMPKDILVQSGKIITINGYSPEKTIGFESFYTIDEIFQFFDSKLSNNPDYYEIEYDTDYGFPKSMFFDMSEMIADEEIGYYITDFKKID
tara:strand:+ start:3384 stop:3812 length:429 start_codon:yes stop_codon:yes gene_type:complete